jgi:hypothetical protein
VNDYDLTVHNPTAGVQRAALVLAQADTTEAVCYGWVPQAKEALAVGVRVVEVRQAILVHGALQPDSEPEEDGSVVLYSGTQWICNECQEVVGTGDDFDSVVSMHQAHMVRLAIVGAS